MITNYSELETAPLKFAADINAVNRIPIVDNLLEVVCRSTGMGFAAVARVTDTNWVACCVLDKINFGLKPGGELQLETTICHEIRQSGDPVIIDHVAEDPAFRNHHTPAMYGFQSYISVPIIRKDGTFFGTLCAIDPKPHLLNTPEIIGMFNLFADLISFHLSSVEQMDTIETRLFEQQRNTEEREQFIAILGHDLLNPMGAVMNATQLLSRFQMDERSTRLVGIIQNSAFRMRGLIDNILDFARGRMGEGITLNIREEEHLEDILNQVITELRIISPNRTININFELNEPVRCDVRRIAQLFSNLLGNALTHGKKDEPVKVYASSQNGEFVLSVTNGGNKIPDAIIERLFEPFSRGGDPKKSTQGLGLGLYIATEIARGHNGNVTATSTDERTCFTLTMPSIYAEDGK